MLPTLPCARGIGVRLPQRPLPLATASAANTRPDVATELNWYIVRALSIRALSAQFRGNQTCLIDTSQTIHQMLSTRAPHLARRRSRAPSQLSPTRPTLILPEGVQLVGYIRCPPNVAPVCVMTRNRCHTRVSIQIVMPHSF